MYERVNKLAGRVAQLAKETNRQGLAAEIYSFLPIEDSADLRRLHAQVRVVGTLLKLRPSLSHRLVEAFNALARALNEVVDSLVE